MNRPIVLSIGTSHPWNVAGTGRDLVIATTLGARVFTAIVAVSAQDARGVRALQPIAPEVVQAQLDALPWRAAGAVRVGALATAAGVRAVAAALRSHPDLPAVVDPVLGSSAGGALADTDASAVLAADLSRLDSVILTPNLAEAAVLLERLTLGRDDMVEAAQTLRARGAGAVLLKGGHLDGDPIDVLAAPERTELFSAPRIAAEMRGTGCTLAMALACELANGSALHDAVLAARAFVRAELNAH